MFYLELKAKHRQISDAQEHFKAFLSNFPGPKLTSSVPDVGAVTKQPPVSQHLVNSPLEPLQNIICCCALVSQRSFSAASGEILIPMFLVLFWVCFFMFLKKTLLRSLRA